MSSYPQTTKRDAERDVTSYLLSHESPTPSLDRGDTGDLDGTDGEPKPPHDIHECKPEDRHWTVEYPWPENADPADTEHMHDCGASAIVLMNEGTGATMVGNDACQSLNCSNLMCAPYQLAKFTAHMEHRFQENGGAWYAKVEVESSQELKQVRRRVSDRARGASDTARLLTVATRDPAVYMFLSEFIEGQWKADPRELTYLEPTDAFDMLSDVLRPENVLSGSDLLSDPVRATSSNRRGVCMLCREWWKAEQKCQGVQSSGAPLCEEDSSWQLPTRHRKYNKSEGGNWKGVLWGPAVTFDIAEDFNDVVWAMYGPDIARLVRERQELLQDEGSDADTGVLDRKVKALTSEIGRMGYERYLEVVTENENDEHEDDR